MRFEELSVTDLIRIAAAGGGFTLNAKNKPVTNLVRIAAAASTHNSKIIFTQTENLSVSDLIRIAAAGKGCVIFE